MAHKINNGVWLRLSDAAQVLGVHPSTVRKWSDEGMLPVHRTEGGHRRYHRQEIELWKQAQRAEKPFEVDLVMQSALRNTRLQISEGHLQSESWYGKLDEVARKQYRESGKTLLLGLMAYLAARDESDTSEAVSIGYEYASRGRRCGLDSLEATRAFLFFRNMLMEAMLGVYEAAVVRSPQAWSDMFRKVNAFTDQILMTILSTYEAYQRTSR